MELRPFLLALSSEDHALELTAALQDVGVPCVLAFNQRMLDYWRRTEQPAVVVLELGLPWATQSGQFLIRQGAAVVGLSNDEDRRMWALGQGYEDALPLSLTAREISARLRVRFLHRDFLPVEVPRDDGPLRMDIGRRRVWWRGDERHLSSMQFDLLAYLAVRRGRMISIETLLRDVWREAWGEWNKVTKMIGRIREALGPDAAGYIVSSPGYYGYMPL